MSDGAYEVPVEGKHQLIKGRLKYKLREAI
jgi:hypothetical protein